MKDEITMTKDEERETAIAVGWLETNHTDTEVELYKKGFEAGYNFAKSEEVWQVGINPQKDGLYLVTASSPRQTREAWWNSRKEIWTTVDGGVGFDVVAWRPLPEPYKEKK